MFLTLRKRRVATVAACAAASVGLMLSVPTTASANSDAPISCQMSGQVYFNPGVQVIPLQQHVTYVGGQGLCDTNNDYGIRSARITADVQGVLTTCEATLGDGSGVGSIEWTTSDGQTQRSTVSLNTTKSLLNNASVTGHITDGLFQGRSFNAQVNTSFLGGLAACTLGAPFGGLQDAGFTGRLNVT